MKINGTIRFLSAAALVASAAGSVPAAVIVGGGKLFTEVHNPGFQFQQQYTPPSNSLHTSTTSAIGGTSSHAEYDFEVTGSTGHMQSTFSLTREGGTYPANPAWSSYTHNYGIVFFSVTDAPVDFSVTGGIALSGGGYVELQSYLTGPSGQVYNYLGTSANVANDALALGDEGGNVNAVSTGNYFGTLGLGDYTFFFLPHIRATNPDGGASASGMVRLEFGPIQAAPAVPEPSTVALFALGALGLAGFARRRRK